MAYCVFIAIIIIIVVIKSYIIDYMFKKVNVGHFVVKIFVISRNIHYFCTK